MKSMFVGGSMSFTKRLIRGSVLLGLVVFGCRSGISVAIADDIDEILSMEEAILVNESRALVEDDLLPLPEPEAEPMPRPMSEPMHGPMQDATALEARLHELEAELASARMEISTLRRQISVVDQVNQEELHRAYYNMGCVYRAIKDMQRAEEYFLKALSINDQDAAVHFNLGILYDDDLGRPEKARYHYEQYLELAPNDRDVPLVKQWLAMMN